MVSREPARIAGVDEETEMESVSRRTRETLVDAICAASCFLPPLLLVALFAVSPSARVVESEIGADSVAVHYAIQATRLNPYVEIF